MSIRVLRSCKDLEEKISPVLRDRVRNFVGTQPFMRRKVLFKLKNFLDG